MSLLLHRISSTPILSIVRRRHRLAYLKPPPHQNKSTFGVTHNIEQDRRFKHFCHWYRYRIFRQIQLDQEEERLHIHTGTHWKRMPSVRKTTSSPVV